MEQALLLVQKNLHNDAGGNDYQHVVATGLHPVVAARRGAQAMAAPVINHIAKVAAHHGRPAIAALDECHTAECEGCDSQCRKKGKCVIFMF